MEKLLNQLQGDPDLAIEDFPPYRQAKAALDQAQRDLDHTLVKAPISGVATQVDNIQLGRFVTAGTLILSVVDDSRPWVDANPKETDITNLRIGQNVEIAVDTFPGHAFHGHVASLGPGTGTQFALLPPQNANGNWVKVVQRVPIRIEFEPGQKLSALRAGMSVTVEIDTKRQRSLASLIGASKSFAEEDVEFVTPFVGAMDAFSPAVQLDLMTDKGRSMLDGLVSQQAAIIAYSEDFRLLKFLLIAVLPLIFTLGSSKSPTSSGPQVNLALE